MKTFPCLIALIFAPSLAFAQTIECALTIEHEADSLRIVTKARSPQSALAKGIQTGCHKLCQNSDALDSCVKKCLELSQISAIQCFDDQDALYQPDLAKARAQLLTPTPQKPEPKASEPSTSGLLLTTWRGNLTPPKRKTKALLLKEPKRNSLLLMPNTKKPPLLL